MTYVPDIEAPTGPGGWHPEDALFVPMRHSDGHLLGILSVDEPNTGLRAGDEELDVLSALSAHAAFAVQAAQEAGDAARHRLALEELLAVSSRLTAEPAVDEILRAVCSGIRDALGFLNVFAQLVDPATGRLEPRASVGWAMEDLRAGGGVLITDVEPLLDPAFEIEGCYLLPDEEARQRVQAEVGRYVTHLNGSGPWAWNQHWLFVPLRDVEDELIGMIWVDEPADRLLPSADRAAGAPDLREPGGRGGRVRRAPAGAALPRRPRSADAAAEPARVRRPARRRGRARGRGTGGRSRSCSATSTTSRS